MRTHLRCIQDFRGYRVGDVIPAQFVSEDALNFYWHGVNDESGWSKSNYLTLPKFAFVYLTEERTQ